MQILPVLILLLISSALLLSTRRQSRRSAWLLSVGVLLAGLVGIGTWNPATDPLGELLPPAPLNSSFRTSDACRKCHPDQYDSWHRSFHRTMTQPANPLSVRGNFAGVSLQTRSRNYRLDQIGNEFWVEMNDPAWEMRFPGGPLPDAIPRVRERVLMTTGSHHLQVYWTLRPESNGMLFQFPFAFSIDQQRWIPVHDSFLRPPADGPIDIEVWNSTCIACHAVGGQPFNNAGDRTMYSRVAEFGIACEACHGPAEQHLREQAQPWRRYAHHFAAPRDASIINPEHLTSSLSSQVCGNCHSVSVELDQNVWAGQGRRYLPGQDLEETRFVLRYAENPVDPLTAAWLAGNPSGMTDHYWRDGTMRVAGREFNAMIESACYLQGDLSCLSCHSMHQGEPVDQLDPQLAGDQPCLQCHARFQGPELVEHTHHPADSSGSQCQNCHMPHTTYGLFSAMRSHRIDSPSVDQSSLYGRPNACNLCHLDKTLEWTGNYLSEWYRQPSTTLSSENREVAAALLWLLKGDAAQRAIAAWHFGWEPATQTSGRHWQAPFLARLLDDPYSVVRFLGGQALGRQSGFEDFTFDFLAPSEERRHQAQEVLQRWSRQTWPAAGSPKELLQIGPGKIDEERVQELISQRDRRSVRIVE